MADKSQYYDSVRARKRRVKELSIQEIKDCLDYDPETGIFVWKKGRRSGQVAGSNMLGYVSISPKRVNYLAHRLAFVFMVGKFPKHQVDHINGDRSDNRWVNLRTATAAQNQQNRTVTETTGARFRKQTGKWAAAIRIHGKDIHLGTFDTAEEAGAAYRKAKAKHHKFNPKARMTIGEAST